MSKKNLKVVIAAASIAVLSANPVSFAATGDACKMGVSVGTGYVAGDKSTSKFQNASDTAANVENGSATYSDAKSTDNKYSKGFFGELGVLYYINDNISLGASFGYQPKNEVKEKTGDLVSKSERKSYSGMLRAKYDFIVTDSAALSPFVEAAAGIEKTEFEMKTFMNNPTGSSIKKDGTVYSVDSSTSNKIKKTGARFEVGAGIQYSLGNARVSAGYTAGFSQGVTQKEGQTIISYAGDFLANGSSSVSSVKNYKTDTQIQHLLKVKMDYVF